jgi:hypothetical protein
MKTPTIVGLASIVVGLAGLVVVLVVTGHDPAVLVSQLPLLAAVGASLFGLDKINKNTNGTLTDLRNKNEALTAENAALRSVATPAQISQVAPIAPSVPVAPAAPISDPATPLADPLNLNGTSNADK